MIDKLKSQQEKLIIKERHEAWENLARKLAHEIKNPLTPIQLTIDKLKSKYSEKIADHEKEDFSKSLLIIGKQIKQIENLVNEFSDFARMPKPILKDNNLVSLIKDNIKLINELDNKIIIDFKSSKSNILLNSDSEQLSRVFFNLIKNSIESIQDKKIDNVNFNGKIDISINENEEIINFIIIDNGLGFGIFKNNIKDILNPYFTTKKKGTGLGLSIVNKIINDHNGKINFVSLEKWSKNRNYIYKIMSTEILIIDDNADIRNIINDLIIEAGYKTRLAANYNQALNEIDKKLPDVAIIDVK